MEEAAESMATVSVINLNLLENFYLISLHYRALFSQMTTTWHVNKGPMNVHIQKEISECLLKMYVYEKSNCAYKCEFTHE